MTVRLELRESGLGRGSGARRRAKLIAANVWGTSAYYPAEVLERDGSRVFTAGLQMFENHLTESERWDRPEGDVGKLVGKLLSDAEYEADNPDGPGLYADVEFYESYRERINEIGDDVGLSVRAHGLTEEAEMDGRYGPVVVSLLAAESVDVVTRAGAGGKLTSILESDRELAGRPIVEKGTQVTDVTKEDFEAFKTELVEAIKGIPAALTEALAVVEPVVENVDEGEAEAVVEAVVIDHAAIVEALRENDLPAVTAGAIVTALSEGKTLEDAIKTQTDLREAFVARSEAGTIVLSESGKATGLARAVELLG